MNGKKHLIHIVGPTASGKTALGILLANYFNTAIISTDSRQFFKEMSIGTAKPNESELDSAKHYFINNRSVAEDYSVGDFERDAIDLVSKLFQEKDVLITVGGSGLYIKALAEGLDEFPDVSEELRETWDNLYEQKGLSYLQTELKAADPDYYEQCDQQNPRRLLRALTVIAASGQAFSHFLKKEKKNRLFENHYIGLSWDRAILYERINKRVDLMLKNGLIEEAKGLVKYQNQKALQTVGYRELFSHFNNEIDQEEATRLIKRNSRRYAKRQMTWFGRNEAINWLEMPKNKEELLEKALLALQKKGFQF